MNAISTKVRELMQVEQASASTAIPKWHVDLRAWREANGCVGPLWDAFASAAQERVKIVKIYFFGFGVIVGSISAYIISR